MSIRVYLVPGFFGFTSLGSLNYFQRVSQVLGEALARHGMRAEVVECGTQPTASIRRRADRLLDYVLETGGLDAARLHFVGHSTGGLDVRLMTTPGVRLRPDDTEELLAGKTRSVITLATPHYGTPLAGFFTTVAGRQLLELLTVLATSRSGRYAIFGGTRLLGMLGRLDDWFGRKNTFLDMVSKRLFARLTMATDDPIWTFLEEVSTDQGAIVQLMPESMHLFNAAVTDRPGVRYASVVTAAPPPPRHYGVADMRSLARAALAGTFTLLHALAGREHPHYPYPHVGADVLTAELRRALPFEVTTSTNDGIVPTLSQVYGNVLSVVMGDHLDVVGQFASGNDNPHGDWLPSKSGYDEERFRATWDAIAGEIAAANG